MVFKKGEHETSVIIDTKSVPSGYVQIAKLLPDDFPKRKHWQRILSDAHEEGYIRAVKLFRTVRDAKTGPVFVDPVEAMAYIKHYERSRFHRPAAPQQEPDDGGKTELGCLVDIEETLAAILDLLREQARRSDSPQWHPQVEDEVGA